jgi:arylsulfatase A-like enzyme
LKRRLIHGYYASTSYVDAQIGKVIEALDRLGLADNTVIVLWGDHGFHLGDLGVWTKHTNYEQANRIPLIIVAPGVAAAGGATAQPASSVDVFPTLAELADLLVENGHARFELVDALRLGPVPVLEFVDAGPEFGDLFSHGGEQGQRGGDGRRVSFGRCLAPLRQERRDGHGRCDECHECGDGGGQSGHRVWPPS